MTLITRIDVQAAAVPVLVAARTAAGDNVLSPGDWPTWAGDYPVIIARADVEHRQSLGNEGPIQFNSTITLTAVGRVEGTNEGSARDAANSLALQVEMALLTNHKFLYDLQIQQVAATRTRVKVDSTGETHIGECEVEIDLVIYQEFDPTIDAAGAAFPPTVALTTVVVDADLAGTFSPTGTFDDPDFPAAATTSPRTTGPDGRNEGRIKVDLSQ